VTDNLTLGPVQVFSNDVSEINLALRLLSERMDELKGLRGRSLIFDRVRVDDAEENKDALNQIPGKAALPASVAYEDEANIFTVTQTIAAPLVHTGTTAGFYSAAAVVQATASANLTDSSGGTANDTVQALTNPADAPATADILRDDLVANLIPELRNNYADLAAKANKALTVLRNLGLMAT